MSREQNLLAEKRAIHMNVSERLDLVAVEFQGQSASCKKKPRHQHQESPRLSPRCRLTGPARARRSREEGGTYLHVMFPLSSIFPYASMRSPTVKSPLKVMPPPALTEPAISIGPLSWRDLSELMFFFLLVRGALSSSCIDELAS